MFDIITIGTATRDIFFQSGAFRVIKDPHFTAAVGFSSHEAQCFALGSKIKVDDIYFTTGGGAMNTAVTFSRQGFRTAVVSKVGRDASGSEIKKELNDEHINTDFLFSAQELRTNTSAILMTANGERTILSYHGAGDLLDENEVDFTHLESGWLYLVLGGREIALFQPLMAFARERGIEVAANPSRAQLEFGYEKFKEIAGGLHILILNREEAAVLTGESFDDKGKIFDKLGGLAKIVVMTDGADGVWASDGVSKFEAGVFKEKELVDRLGAGDAFGSAFTAAIMRGETIEEALRQGSANATSVVEHIGAKKGILTLEELKDARWQNLEIRATKYE